MNAKLNTPDTEVIETSLSICGQGIIAYKFLDKKPAIQDYKQEIKKIKLFQDVAA